MYNELYDLWKQEMQSTELAKLPPSFYSDVANYLKQLRQEGRMLDKRTVKARLLQNEGRNVKRMIRELVRTRCAKLIKEAKTGGKAQSDTLTAEEEKLFTKFSSLTEAYQAFAKSLLKGHVPQMDAVKESKNCVLRFLIDIPAIMAANMKSYGPFKAEDIAAIPMENAKILIRQGLADRVEIS